MEVATTEKISEIDKHVACACSGLMADSRTMVDRARVEALVCFRNSRLFLDQLILLLKLEPLVPLRRDYVDRECHASGGKFGYQVW